MPSARPSASLRIAAALVLIVCALGAPAAEPVAEVRVAFDRNGVVDTRAQGFADIAAGRKAGADDPVRIASISKLVLTIGVLRLVEDGKLDLDQDISRTLGRRLRHPQYPNRPITLRMLLSHRSSLTDAAGYYAIPLDGTLKSVLDDPRAWDGEHAPGTFFRYANLNFPLVAALMEKSTGERFDKLMDRRVLRPLGIAACYNWENCDEATAARAVVLYDVERKPVRDDHHGRKPACSVNLSSTGDCDLSRWRSGVNGALFSPQGGLRISANGLAKIGRLLLGDGEIDGVRLLKPASVRAMMGPEWTYAPGTGMTSEEDLGGEPPRGFFCRYGLAMQTLATRREGCHDDPFGDGRARVGHSGSAYGLVSGLWVDREAGTGVAYFATGMPEGRRGERSAFSEVEESLASGSRP